MNRRTFLQRSTQLAAATAIAGFARPSLAAPRTGPAFSIDVVTDQPDRAIEMIQNVIGSARLQRHTLGFAEHTLPGRHVSDLAYVRGQRLIDYRAATDAFTRQLAGVARSLGLPRPVEDPTLLRFYADDLSAQPQYVNVFSGDVLMARIPVDEHVGGRRFETHRGHVDVAVKNRRARIVGASCRHKTCMEMGAIHRPGQSLVCIPAQISVTMDGHSDVDSVTF